MAAGSPGYSVQSPPFRDLAATVGDQEVREELGRWGRGQGAGLEELDPAPKLTDSGKSKKGGGVVYSAGYCCQTSTGVLDEHILFKKHHIAHQKKSRNYNQKIQKFKTPGTTPLRSHQ